MRILVFFDLPVKTKKERKTATDFRKFLLEDGFYMVQFSVYARVCNGQDAVKKHTQRVSANVPENGSVRLLNITEKQYQEIKVLVGDYKPEEKSFIEEQISIF